jgi:hypothetical protein
VFFWSEPKTPWWKVVFKKEPRSRQVGVDTYDDNIETCAVVFGLKTPLDFSDLETSKTLVGAIELNKNKVSWLFRSYVVT